MKPTRRISRRSFLGRVAGGAVAAGGAFAVLIDQARAQVTDSDPHDAVGNGRGTGITDGDPSDPGGNGRGTGVTDGDRGRYADPAGRGRGRSGITDGDPG